MSPNNWFSHIKNREKADFQTVLIAIICIMATWLFVMEWSPSQFLGGGDTMSLEVPYYFRLLNVGGDWTQLMYCADWLGGVNAIGAWGVSLFLHLCALLAISPKNALNMQIFFTQLTFVFLGCKIITCLLCRWHEKQITLSPMQIAFTSLLLGFTPLLGYRFTQGHATFMMSSYFILSIIVLLFSVYQKSLTFITLFFTLWVIVASLTVQAYQQIVYGLIFGAPVLWFFGRPYLTKKTVNVFFIVSGIGFIAILLSFPKLYTMLTYGFGSDTARNLKNSSIIYSYVTANLTDWISSLFWAKELVSTGRDPYLFHEINYPFGPFLLLVFLIPWAKGKKLLLSLFIVFFVVIAFSMNIAFITEILTTIFPILEAFRVPERAILPFASFLPLVALSGIFYRLNFPKYDSMAQFVLLGIAIFISFIVYAVPNFIKEPVLWTYSGLFVYFVLKPYQDWKKELIIPLMLILTAGTLAAFKERLNPFIPETLVMTPLLQLKNKVTLLTKNELLTGLTRVHYEDNNIEANQGFAVGTSSLNGYGALTSRFQKLYYALLEKPLDTTTSVFELRPNQSFFGVFQKLYNIQYLVNIGASTSKRLDPNPGEAWFAQTLEPIDSYMELAKILKSFGNNTALFKNKAYYLTTDSIIEKEQPLLKTSKECINSTVGEVSVKNSHYYIKVNTGFYCSLLMAMNYTENLQAIGFKKGESYPLITFPVNGSLLGIFIPSGIENIEIKPRYF